MALPNFLRSRSGLVMLGFLVKRPTILTVDMFPFLVRIYRHLARRDERDCLATFGETYVRYMVAVPPFVPRLTYLSQRLL